MGCVSRAFQLSIQAWKVAKSMSGEAWSARKSCPSAAAHADPPVAWLQ